MKGALSGCCVLDLTGEKGMFCTRLLAGLGAEVIRIDRPGTAWPNDPFFLENAVGKLGITLDIESEAGRRLFRELVDRADVLVESQPPGYLDSLELGYAELSKKSPRLVMASLTDFGQDGPRRDWRSCDLVNSALGGSASVSGLPGEAPLRPPGRQSYRLAGLYGAIGVMLALWRRHASGRGQHIDIAAQDCVAGALDHVLVRYLYQGVIAGRQGSRLWNSAFDIFPCRDGYILMTMFQQWETLVEWLDSEGMAGDLVEARWLDPQERLQHAGHIAAVLERWTRSHTVAELVETGQLMHFPWAPVSNIPEVMASPQLAARQFFSEVTLPDGERYNGPGAPCLMSGSPWQSGGRVPGIGEHNREVYHRLLGLSREEVEELAREGII